MPGVTRNESDETSSLLVNCENERAEERVENYAPGRCQRGNSYVVVITRRVTWREQMAKDEIGWRSVAAVTFENEKTFGERWGGGERKEMRG